MNLRSLLLPAVACVVMATSAHASPQVSGRKLLVDAADVQHYLDGSFPRPTFPDFDLSLDQHTRRETV